jgi:uncharacterized protein YjiS (DUF1127 family)
MIELGNLITRWFDRQTRVQKTVYELNQLTDRELSDLGISRCDIDRVAKEAADV